MSYFGFTPKSPSAHKEIQEKGGKRCTDPVKSEPRKLLEHLTGGHWRVSRAKKGVVNTWVLVQQMYSGQDSPTVVSCVARPPGIPMLLPPT